jgi:hypothetical protein
VEPQSKTTSASNLAGSAYSGGHADVPGIWSVRIPCSLCSLIELDESEKATEGTACRSGKSTEEEHDNDAVRTFVGDRVR